MWYVVPAYISVYQRREGDGLFQYVGSVATPARLKKTLALGKGLPETFTWAIKRVSTEDGCEAMTAEEVTLRFTFREEVQGVVFDATGHSLETLRELEGWRDSLYGGKIDAQEEGGPPQTFT